MIYKLFLTNEAEEGMARLQKSGDKAVLKKLETLLNELRNHPRTGTGHVEQLKHFHEETWSRRINREHRIIYRVCDEVVEVLVLSAYGHYCDK